MHRPRLLLEARRSELYQKMEVLENWHRKYERGKVSVEKFAAIKHEKFSRKSPTSLKETFQAGALARKQVIKIG